MGEGGENERESWRKGERERQGWEQERRGRDDSENQRAMRLPLSWRMQGVMIVRERHDAESREKWETGNFPASPRLLAAFFPAFHLRCRVPKISELAASFLPGAPLKFSHCDEWSLRSGLECRCCLSVPVEVAAASPFHGLASVDKNSLLSSTVGAFERLSGTNGWGNALSAHPSVAMVVQINKGQISEGQWKRTGPRSNIKTVLLFASAGSTGYVCHKLPE